MSSQHVSPNSRTPEQGSGKQGPVDEASNRLRFPDSNQRLRTDFGDGIDPHSAEEAAYLEGLREGLLTPLEIAILDLVEAQPAVIAKILPQLRGDGNQDVDVERTEALNYAEVEALLLERGALEGHLTSDAHTQSPGDFVKHEVLKARRKLHLAMNRYRAEQAQQEAS